MLLTQIDAQSYLLGQRQALERTVREIVPTREALGGIKAQLDELRSASSGDVERTRRVEGEIALLRQTLQSQARLLQDLERKRMPNVEHEVASLRGAIGASLRAPGLQSFPG